MRRPHITDKKYSTGITKISRNYDYHVDLDKYCDFLEAKHAKKPTVQADAKCPCQLEQCACDYRGVINGLCMFKD